LGIGGQQIGKSIPRRDLRQTAAGLRAGQHGDAIEGLLRAGSAVTARAASERRHDHDITTATAQGFERAERAP